MDQLKINKGIKLKNRQTKTIYEKFSHHKINNLKIYKEEIKKKLDIYFSYCEKKNIIFDLNKALLELNINVDGKFYLRGLGEPNKINKYGNESEGYFKDGKWIAYYDCCDAYYFQDFDEPLPRVELKNGKEYVEFQVLMSDYDNKSLIIHKDIRDNLYWMKIISSSPKNNDILLEGNIGRYIN